MNYKQIYLYDGTPYLLQYTDEGEGNHPVEDWTDIAPPEGLYQPIHFDGERWVGTSKEEWEENRPPSEPYKPEATEILLARTQLQIAKMASLQEKAQQELAKAIQEIAKLQGGN